MSTQCLFLEDFGGGVGVADNTPALEAAFAALPACGGCIQALMGVYNFETACTLAFPSANLFSLILCGIGKGATVFKWASNVGDSLTLALSQSGHAFQIKDATFATAVAGGGVAINAIGSGGAIETFAEKSFDHVEFRGADGFEMTDYWSLALNVSGLSNVFYDRCTFYGSAASQGNAAVVSGIGSSAYAYGHFFTRCGFFGINNGVVMSSYVQTLYVSDGTFGGNSFVVTNQGQSGGLLDLAIVNNQITANSTAIPLGYPVQQVSILSNLFYMEVASTIAIFGYMFEGGVIAGNRLYSGPGKPSNNIAICIETSVGENPTIITGNTIYEFLTAISLAAGSSWVNVQSNAYIGNTNKVSNLGSNNTIGGGSE